MRGSVAAGPCTCQFHTHVFANFRAMHTLPKPCKLLHSACNTRKAMQHAMATPPPGYLHHGTSPKSWSGLRGFRMIPTYMHTCARGERPFVSEPHLAVASLSIGERAFEVNDLGARSL